MKKFIKIFTYLIIVLLIAAIVVFWFYKSDILKSLLINKTQQAGKHSIQLKIDSVYYNPLIGKVKVYQFQLSSTDSIEQKGVLPLQTLSFDSLVAEKFSLFHLIFKNTVKLGELTTTKPKLVINTTNSKDTTIVVSEQFKAINGEAVRNILPIIMDRVLINYGSVKLMNSEDGKNETTADFSIELFGFNTIKNSLQPDSSTFLFSERIIISANSIAKIFDENRKFTMAKLNFDSQNNLLVFDSVLYHNNDSVNGEHIFVNEFKINGIDLKKIKHFKQLQLNSIKINGANVSIIDKNRKKKNKSELLQIILKEIEQLDIGRVDVSKLNFNLQKPNGGSLIVLENVNAQIENISFDSSSYNFRQLPKYDGFELNVDAFSLDTNFMLNGKSLRFDDDILQLSDLSFKKDSSYNFRLPSVKIHNIKPELFLQNKAQTLYLELEKPDLEIVQPISSTSSQGKQNYVYLDSLKLIDAKFRFKMQNGALLRSNKLNLKFNYVKPLAINNFRIPDTFNIHSENLEFTVKNGTEINIGDLKSDNNFTSLQNGKISFSNEKQQLFLNWDNLLLNQTDYQKLFTANILDAGNIQLYKPNISLNLMSDSSQKQTDVDSIIIKLPLSIKSNYLEIINGDAKIDFNDGLGMLNTGFDFKLEKVDYEGFITLEELLNSKFKLSLVKPQFNTDIIKLKSNKLAINQSAKDLNVNDLSLLFLNKTTKDTILIIKSGIISLDNFDAFGSIKNNRVIADNLSVNNLIADIIQDDKPKGRDINLNTISEIDTLYFDINHLNLKSTEGINLLSVNSTKFQWIPESSSSLFNEILIENEGLVYDTPKLKFSMDKIYTKRKDDDIVVDGFILNSEKTDTSKLYLYAPKLEIHDFITEKFMLNSLNINSLVADTIILNYQNKLRTQSKTLNFKNLRLPFENLLINSIDFKSASINISAKNKINFNDIALSIAKSSYLNDGSGLVINNINVDLKNNDFYTSDSLYKFDLGNFNYSFIDSSLLITSVDLIPLKTAEEFFKYKQYQSDYVSLSTSNVKLKSLDIFKLINKNEIDVRSLNIEGTDLSVYRDKRYEFKSGTKKPMPGELILSIPQKFEIDSVIISKSKILYGEYVYKSEKPGEIYFDNFNLLAENFSNSKTYLKLHQTFNIDFNTMVMGKSMLSANIQVPMNKPSTFSFSGHTEEINFSDFNSMAQNLFGISVMRGTGSLDIKQVYASDSLSRGDIYFKYKKLRIALYDREKASLNKGIASPFFRFLVNDLLIKSNNPRTFGRTRKGVVYFNRDTERSFLNYMWKSLVSGMLSTMWHNSKEQRKEKRLDRKSVSLN